MRSALFPWLLVAASAVVPSSGCTPREVLGKVSGRVQFEGQPVKEGVVIFANKEKGVYVQAELQSGGVYEVQMAKGYGLPLGEYVVYVSPKVYDFPVGPPPGGKPPPPVDVSQMPALYRRAETTPLRLTVARGENRFDIDMKADGGK